MKFTLNWLKDYLDSSASLEEICACLTEIGLEVEEISDKAKELADFKVVEVLEVSKHPSADRLNICQVKTEQEEFSLVCGAHNVKAPMKAVLAPLGSVVPANGMKVKKAKIRGVESIGMLCSAYELGLGEDHDGIIDLPLNTKIGEPIADILGLADPLIEIAITPNRGDCLGVYGIARDLAAAGLGRLKKLEITEPEAQFNSKFKAVLKDQTAQSLNFIELRNLKTLESPSWLKNRLTAIGIKPKSAPIDVTNYVAYNFGQPMHAYDAARLNGVEITAQLAGNKQEFNALDDESYQLEAADLVIADQKHSIALAGIIGGRDSACSEQTNNILLEAANFSADQITQTGRRLQLDTDSRYRFERNIDPNFTTQALYYAANLLSEICGAETSQLISQAQAADQPKIVIFNFAKLEQLAAYQLGKEQIKDIFTKLGFTIIAEDQVELKLQVPSWRNDVALSADLYEEILRIAGFSQIPYLPFEPLNKIEQNNLDINAELKLKKITASKGYTEIIGWSFVSKESAENFEQQIILSNPISSDLLVMRENLLPNLLENAKQAQNHGQADLAIFEYGRVFKGLDAKQQPKILAGLKTGKRAAKELNNDNSAYDIYDVKADCLALLAEFGLSETKLNFVTTELAAYYHPTRSANLLLGKNLVASFGELHPKLARKYGFKERVNIFELHIANLPQLRFKLPKFANHNLQAITRDFSFIVDQQVAAGDIKKAIFKLNKELITEIRIFDLYLGDKLAEGKKSLALNVTIQPKDASLTGEELEKFNEKVINHICDKFAAVLH